MFHEFLIVGFRVLHIFKFNSTTIIFKTNYFVNQIPMTP